MIDNGSAKGLRPADPPAAPQPALTNSQPPLDSPNFPTSSTPGPGMPPLIRFDSVSVAFGDQKILVEATLTLEPGERVCLIGRNGAGKSTTLKLLTGALEPDTGKVERPSSLRWSLLDQRLAEESALTAREFIALGMAAQLERIARFQRLSAGADPDAALLREIEAMQREIDAGGGWSVDMHVDLIICQLDVPADKRLDEHFGRLAAASCARSSARLEPGPAAARRADKSSRHQYDRVARRQGDGITAVRCCS